MKVTVDTNILVRSLVRDDESQAAAADQILRSASLIAITLPCLCELVWVLTKLYGITREDVVRGIRALLSVKHVAADRPAIEMGLKLFELGGDFADGAIAYQGAALGGQTFVSFDKKAIKLISATGMPTQQA